ncbi:hypothetical protein SeMB42_g06092 [Synchytrium endobioticum]|nr:hypothetical protein SeMB42_g06092 [Synchytrium endobioticum]
MTQSQLANTFPKSAMRLGLSDTGTDRVDIRNYLFHVNQINQMAAMALQIRVDVNLTNHKYMAHQLALLYQCLNLVGEPFNKYQAAIQQEFESIKASTSTSRQVDSPQLSDHQKQWLSDLTLEIVSSALFSRESILPKAIESLMASQL